MKKIVITTLLLLLLAFSACTEIQDYLPGYANNVSGNATFTDPFVITDNENDTQDDDVEVIDLDEDEDDDSDDADDTTDSTSTDGILASLEVIEGDLVNLDNLQAQDPDGDSIEYTFSEPLSEEGTWQTQDGDEGTYLVTVTASDGLLSTSEKIQIIVGPSNKGPVIDCPDSYDAKEGSIVELPCTIYDKEGDEVSFDVSGYATNLTFTTDFDSAGDQEITITATDGNKVTTKTVSLEIENTNRPPVVEAIDELMVLEGDSIRLLVDAIDADGDDIEIEYPLVFDNQGRWTTEKGDAGTYELEVVVSDGEDEVVLPIKIVVEKVNSAPTLVLADSITVNEGELIDLDIEASDVDGDGITITIEGFMTSQTYQTTFQDAGEYEVTVTATDGKKDVSKTTTITINDVNRAPVFVFK